MATSSSSSSSSSSSLTNCDVQDIISGLPKVKGFFGIDLYLYQGTYYSARVLPGVIRMQQLFHAQPDDIFITSFPKTGTTWLKSIVFAILNRNRCDKETHPLINKVSHDYIPPLEHTIYADHGSSSLDGYLAPRLFSTHANYNSLPKSLIDCRCKIVYICRDPKDVFVSMWHFIQKVYPQNLPAIKTSVAMNNKLVNDYDFFCKGLCAYGSYWDHVLSYWKPSIDNNQNILFLKYEDMKREPQSYVKKLADFLGDPFTLEEQENGKVQEIVDLCSFEFLSNLKVNQTGLYKPLGDTFTNDAFFRKGNVGDWKNHLTREMAEQMDNITRQKLHEYGLTL